MTAIEPQALPHTLAAPGLARRYLRSVAGAWPAELFDVVVLLTGELVTNAMVHGRAPVHVLLIDDGNRLRVEVSDGGGGSLPRTPPRPADVDASGRGLLIVDRVADQWGTNRTARHRQDRLVRVAALREGMTGHAQRRRLRGERLRRSAGLADA